MKYTKEQMREIGETVEELSDMVVPTPMSEASGFTLLLAIMNLNNTLEEIKELMQKQ